MCLLFFLFCGDGSVRCLDLFIKIWDVFVLNFFLFGILEDIMLFLFLFGCKENCM